MTSTSEAISVKFSDTTTSCEYCFKEDLNISVVNETIATKTSLDWVDLVEIVLHALVALSGIPGNVVVVLVQLKATDITSTDYLIANLAAVDLIDSSVIGALKVINIFSRDIASTVYCKMYAFPGYWVGMLSASFIGALSIDRYLLACRPLSNNCIKTRPKLLCVGIYLLNFILSTPTIILREYDDALKECFYIFEKTINIYFMFLAMLILIDFTVVAVLYCKIALLLRRRMKKQEIKAKFTCKYKLGYSQDIHSNANLLTHSGYVNSTQLEIVSENTSVETRSTNDAGDFNHFKENQNSQVHYISQIGTPKDATISKSKKKLTNRTTLIIFLISVIYIVSYTIAAVVIVYKNRLGQSLYQLLPFIRKINNIANPVLFATMSSKFRKNAKRILCDEQT